MPCQRCFHIVCEHYLCLDHGGEPGWMAGAAKLKPRRLDYPPVEALNNFHHPWWDFLDQTDYKKLPVSPMGQMKFREMVP